MRWILGASLIFFALATAQGQTAPQNPHNGGIAPIYSGYWLHKARAAKTMDLPMAPPYLGGPGYWDLRDPFPQPDEEGEDPRDTPPPVFFGEEIEVEKESLVYVIDYSCSMSLRDAVGEPTRLDRAKAEVEASVSGLAENMRFDVRGFDCAQKVLWDELREATSSAKAEAINWTKRLRYGGGTGTGPNVAWSLVAYGADLGVVVLLTDGGPGCGAPTGIQRGRMTYAQWDQQQHRDFISSHNRYDVPIYVFGIAASGDYRAFCQGVAGDSGGNYIDVP